MKAVITLAAFAMLLVAFCATGSAQPAESRSEAMLSTIQLPDVRIRDACILPDEETETYYMVASSRGAAVRAYTSQDLINWEGPHIVYETPEEMWGTDVDIRSIWAPEIHKYKGKYYLFLTFSSTAELPEQWNQWFDWRPRVRRASQVLVSDSPLGPYEAFSNEPTLPADMMSLDGTLWEEDGVPYMVYCHEWVQIVDGAISMVPLTEDLSEMAGETEVLFRASEAPWVPRTPDDRVWVTDGPWLYVSKSGKLFMPWSSFTETGYTVGLAVSESGKLAGPWTHRDEPIYRDNGGHSMLFETFDGRLVMALHSPNESPNERIHLFELEDTGDTLRITGEITGD